MYQLNLSTFEWTQIKGNGDSPLNRFGHTAIIYDHSMYIFGGWNGHDTLDDLYQYSFASNYWYEIRRIKGEKPLPRYRHCAVVCNQNLYIFGGVDTSQQRFNDIYSFDIEKRYWAKL